MSKYVIIFVFLFGLMAGQATTEQLDYAPGSARFKAGFETVFFPANVQALYFDTIECCECFDSLPEWRFLGPLKVDSIKVDGKFVPLTDKLQMSGIRFDANDLAGILQVNGVYMISRRIHHFEQFDTLWRDPISGQWNAIPELSKHFRIWFSKDRDAFYISDQLKAISDLTNVGVVPVRVIDPPIHVIDVEQLADRVLKCWIPGEFDSIIAYGDANYKLGYLLNESEYMHDWLDVLLSAENVIRDDLDDRSFADIVFIREYLMNNGYPSKPVCCVDANCDGIVDLGDVVFLSNYYFKNGPPPIEGCCE